MYTSTKQDSHQLRKMQKLSQGNLFYFYEISSRLDCGSTIQIINDYSHLSREGWEIYLPIISEQQRELPSLNDHIEGEAPTLLSLSQIKNRSKYINRFILLKNFIAWLMKAKDRKKICIIREDKHLGIAVALRIIFRFKIISEIHEAGLPETSRSGKKQKYQNFLNSVQGIILTSNAQKVHITSKYFRLPNHIVLPNGVEIEYFERSLTNKSDEKIITYTGMFNPWKNVPLLFQALRLLPDKYKLRIAGGKINCPKSAKYIHNLVIENQVDNRVDFKGFINRENLVEEVLDGSSVLAVPLDGSISALYATSPMKLIEYLATKIPIVAVKTPSIGSIATNKEVIFCEANPESFARAIYRACEENQEQLITSANKLAKEYSHQTRALRYSQWLSRDILKQDTSGRPALEGKNAHVIASLD